MTPLEAAHGYADHHWNVIPVQARDKPPAIADWVNAATDDHGLIDDWWGRWPDYNVGIVTGAKSGIFVLDVDGQVGEDSLHDLEATYGELPKTVECLTGTGQHLYFRWPAEGEIRNDQAGRLGPNLDIRGEGGQVVAPPSIHPSGRQYHWSVDGDPSEVPVADAPPWLIELLTSAPSPSERRSERQERREDHDDLPGTWWAERVTWAELLEGDGATWMDSRTDHDTGLPYELWSRPPMPGEEGFRPHTSASLFYKGSDVLKVFTSNWRGIDAETGEVWSLELDETYTKLGYLAARSFGGDLSMAAAACRALQDEMVDEWIASLPTAELPSPEEPAEGTVPDVYDLLNSPDPEYDWLIPGLLERHDRVILTGAEGHGKSTLFRQLGVQAGAGISPFSLERFDPLRVVHVDLENPEAIMRRELRETVALAEGELGRGQFFPVPRPEGLDLADPSDYLWLAGVLAATRADLLLIGPLYKMALGDPTLEETAKHISMAIDKLRVEYRCAVLIEAHSPHKQQGERPGRPYGASLWLRWPEVGLFLTEQGHLRPWRGHRSERAWPLALTRDGHWKWSEATDVGAKYADILAAARALVSEGEEPSYGALAIRAGIPKSTVGRMAKNLGAKWLEELSP